MQSCVAAAEYPLAGSSFLNEAISDRRERKLRRQTGAANDAGDGTGQQDKGIDVKGKGEWPSR
jgi:hypothetical protein